MSNFTFIYLYVCIFIYYEIKSINNAFNLGYLDYRLLLKYKQYQN